MPFLRNLLAQSSILDFGFFILSARIRMASASGGNCGSFSLAASSLLFYTYGGSDENGLIG